MLSKLLPLNIQTQGVSWNIPIATMILRKEGCCLQTWLNLWPCLPIAMPGTPRSEPRPGSTQHKKEQESEAWWRPAAAHSVGEGDPSRRSSASRNGDGAGGWHCWGIIETGTGKSKKGLLPWPEVVGRPRRSLHVPSQTVFLTSCYLFALDTCGCNQPTLQVPLFL